jgi:LAO/AO transport system kinase
VKKEVKSKWLEIRKQKKLERSPATIFEQLKLGSRVALSQSITLLESQNAQDRELAKELISLALPYSGNSIRVGITGVPGVGKSTFIESFGTYLLSQGKKLAVLAIDPSSEEGGGSILGDKTRMETLSAAENAFIRPSPAGRSLGGVARATRESVLMCEAAGYDFILIETVGVGQSETLVHSMVDFFLLLMLAGAGDELQGIKRGIMEMADLLLINKADGDNAQKAQIARREYKNALHLFPPKKSNWIANTFTISSIDGTNMDKVYKEIIKYENQTKISGWFEEQRGKQDLKWYHESLRENLLAHFMNSDEAQLDMKNHEKAILKKKISPFEASEEWINKRIK